MADVYRNVNIIHEFNSSSSTSMIDVYQPGFLNPYDIVNGLKYAGFITSLRLTVEITSIAEVEIVPTTITDDSEAQRQAERDTFLNNPKKCLSFFMRNSTTPPLKIVDIYLFNQTPYYYIDLLPYFTSVESFDVGNDTIISCQFRDTGNGILSGDDRVLLLGGVVERAPKEDNTLEVYS